MNHLILDAHINRILRKLNVNLNFEEINNDIILFSILERGLKPVFEKLFRYAC